MDRILVAVDGSNQSFEALKKAIEFSKVSLSKICLVNVQPSFNTLHSKVFIDTNLIKEYQEELFENATKSAVEYLKTEKIEFESHLQTGNPAQQICQLAKELNVQFIALGSRGMGLIKGTMLGSVSNGVLHLSEIPILIVPEKK